MSFSSISFILHKPQLSENIGACARALKNFNFEKHVPKYKDIKDTCLAIGYDCLWNENAYKEMDFE